MALLKPEHYDVDVVVGQFIVAAPLGVSQIRSDADR
jgi:hypothetical protein